MVMFILRKMDATCAKCLEEIIHLGHSHMNQQSKCNATIRITPVTCAPVWPATLPR